MRKLYKSRYNKKLSGVCAGIGNYFSVDPTLIRLIFIFLLITPFFLLVLIAYFVLAMIMPLEPANSPAIEYRKLYRSTNDRVFAGICGGLAKLLKVDSTVLRLLILVLGLITGIYPLVFTYIICWILVPERNL